MANQPDTLQKMTNSELVSYIVDNSIDTKRLFRISLCPSSWLTQDISFGKHGWKIPESGE